MGRKIDMKKIEDITKCQVTFSKRRSSLMKKANEIAVCCDVDVAFVAFSPSGRISKFCNQRRIEDVLHRYVNLPVEKRLKDYELGPEQEPSLHQLSWCERNLNHSLERIIAKKVFNQMGEKKLERQFGNPLSSNFNQNEQVSRIENPSTGQILMQLDPWISPYSARVRENILQDLLDQAKHTTNKNIGPSDLRSFPMPSNILNFPIPNSSPIFVPEMTTSNARVPSFHVPQEKFLVVDHNLLNFHGQNNVNARNNNFQAVLSDRIHVSTQNLCNIQGPRFTSTTTVTTKASGPEMPQSIIDEIETGSQCTNSNLRQFTNVEGQEIGYLNMDSNGSFDNGKTRNDNEDYCKINGDQVHASDQSDPSNQNVYPHNEVCQNTLFNDFLPEDTVEDNTIWTSKIQKSALWEWDDLLLDVQDYF
ncbi:Agamous-like MADS-box protein [Sesamum alatum]|uniref:Agamous-like MADS-box protein n=1 Tax=Sesamum alatum TaxID=300844 RepID=A0AAE1YIA1_9LAMI|nr:Agamous-like MADS-box protein [Sesamum alatum]